MIAADKQELESRLKQNTLQIREKEILVFTDNFSVLSTQAAFLTGLGFGGLTMTPSWKFDKKALEILFYTLLSTSIGFNILTLCISSWCMIFGPSLAIRGPDGSMSRAVEGMYAERKWALRFFWLGLLFIMLSGISLGWLKFHPKTASTMTVIFVSFIFTFFAYVKYRVRPRFRFPKDARRKPKEFRVGGYDPETGKHNGDEKIDDPLEKSVADLQKLKMRGILSPGEADAKIAVIRQQQDEARVVAKQGSNQSIRNRLGFGAASSGASSSASGGGGMSDTASIYSSGGRSVASTAVGSSSSGAGGQDLNSSSHSGSGSGDVMAGMLLRDGKLHRVSLSPFGVLTMASLAGGKGSASKSWSVSGGDGKVSVSEDSKANHFVVTVGKTKLKLGANCEDEMVAWMQAISQAARQGASSS